MEASRVNRSETEALVDATALWILGDTPVDTVLEAAVDLIVAGADSAALRELAGMSDAEDPWQIRAVLGRTFDELGLEMPDAGATDTVRLALRELGALLLHDRISVRELIDRARALVGDAAGTVGAAELIEIGEALDSGRSTAHEAQLASIDWATGYLRPPAAS
ncbi:hypothetical protein ACFPER_16055 [Agromyces aurantiacus]|uniref:DUF222 domain-containing protein n=1 Tax=Agromyces aurantiacus TaxID=165814 RepID=A0ABV9RAM5_9MICO|nr:hypothetical protein [Agromyces aurantiacus]MBM7504794.1 hypothetical protein [Agromyces aurantiacus]